MPDMLSANEVSSKSAIENLLRKESTHILELYGNLKRLNPSHGLLALIKPTDKGLEKTEKFDKIYSGVCTNEDPYLVIKQLSKYKVDLKSAINKEEKH